MSTHDSVSRRGMLFPMAAAAASVLLPHHRVNAAESVAGDGPVLSGIMQVAYIVPDLQKAMKAHVEHMGIGPWFVTESFKPKDMLYRGQPTAPDVTIGMSFSGAMNIELIQQRDNTPSVYKETEKRSGFGFHHWAVGTTEFDKDLARYIARGTPVAFSMTLGSGVRLAYIDTTEHLAGMIELIEIDDSVKTSFTRMYRETRNWDGKTVVSGG